MDTATINVLVIVVGCIIGLAGWVRTTKMDSSELAARIHTLEIHVEHMQEEIDDLKHKAKNNEAGIQKAIEESVAAEHTIASLQDRL